MFDFSSMMEEYAVPIEIQLKSGKDGGSYNDAGEWIPNGASEPLRVDEPLLPPSQQMSFVYGEGGAVNSYDLDWYSEQSDIAVGTIVKELRTGRVYQVAGITADYRAYSSIIIYQLKAVGTSGEAI